MSESRGITLIILIITIVVLIILAGVIISNITSDEGVLQEASYERDKTKIASEEAVLGNVAIEETDKFGDITEEGLRTALSKYNVEITPSGGLYRIVFKDSNNLYKMNHQGEFFYWEDMAPTDIYAKKDGTTLYLRSTPQNGYTKGTRWTYSSVTKIVIEEPIAPSTCYLMFNRFSSLKEIENIENLHTENVTDMSSMFYNCGIQSLNLNYFDTSKVEDMNTMFYACPNLESLYINNWDTHSNKTMKNMFRSCTKLKNLDLSNFDTRNVSTMERVFQECGSLTSLNLSNFDTTKVNTMQSMFSCCSSLKILDLSSFNTNIVTNMEEMFYQNTNLQILDISHFNTSIVTDMSSMFRACSNLTTIYASNQFNAENVGDTVMMFSYSSNLVGGNGTKYSSSKTNGTYARIDAPGIPGYFTLKTNN
ncbi:MAG: BspA family leucine-rich repeat surface protein [Clostridia bacterium]|nr:BspA family leucine-rich repeat surface protein [Clostridia bacterium]